MRNWLTVVAAIACAGLVACGGGDGSGENNGGTGGGTGGTGGTPEPVCGNGAVEDGEECDDGNTADGDGCNGVCVAEFCGDGVINGAETCDEGDTDNGDGCSAECLVEGSCDVPFNLNAGATIDPVNSWYVIEGEFINSGTSTMEGSCGGESGEYVYGYTVGQTGLLYYALGAEAPIKMYVRRDCDDTETELTCIEAVGQLSTFAGSLEVTAGEYLYFVFDSQATIQSANFALYLLPLRYLEEGDECEMNGAGGVCRPEVLRCARITSRRNECVPNTAPTIGTVSAQAVGADLVITVTGEDADLDVQALRLSFLDANDEAMAVWQGGLTEGTWPLDPIPTEASFSTSISIANFFAIVPDAKKTRVALFDSGSATSEYIVQEILEQPVVDEGGSCDPAGILNRCNVGLACEDDGAGGGICHTEADVRINQCGASTVILNAGSDIGVAGGQSLWDPPESCYGDVPGIFGGPEAVITMTLEAESTVTVSTNNEGTDFDTVLYVLQACAATAETTVLGCQDDVDLANGNSKSELTLSSLPAGTYTVIVDTAFGNPGNYELTVTAQ